MCPRIFALARLQSVGFPQSRSFLYLRVLLDFQVQWLGPRNQQGAVCVMSGQPEQGASAVLKGAPLAPLRFLHAYSCLVASSCIEGEWPRPTIRVGTHQSAVAGNVADENSRKPTVNVLFTHSSPRRLLSVIFFAFRASQSLIYIKVRALDWQRNTALPPIYPSA